MGQRQAAPGGSDGKNEAQACPWLVFTALTGAEIYPPWRGWESFPLDCVTACMAWRWLAAPVALAYNFIFREIPGKIRRHNYSMTQANIELLYALKEAGVSEATAEAAAQSVAASGEVATKADLAELKAWLAWPIMGTAGVVLAGQAVAVGVLAAVLR